MSEPGPRLWTWPRLVAVTLARSLLVGLLGLAAWGAVPAVFGWHPTTVSSGSMMPRLHVGDIAVSRPLGTHVPPLSSVLLFHDPDHPDRLRMHRFVRLDEDGQLVTRGDANNADDSSPVALGAVLGIGTLRVPWVALPIVWLREGQWLFLALVAAGLASTLAVAATGRDRGFGDDDAPTDDSGGPPAHEPAVDDAAATRGHAGRAARRGVLRRAGVLPATVLLCATYATAAEARFADTTATSVSLGLGYSTCANAVSAFNPVLWYRMDETSSLATSAVDASGNGRTGGYGFTGKTTTTARACAQDTGRAMTFNGSTGYLSSPQLGGALPNTFSLAIWFRTTTRNGGKLIGFGNQQTGASSVYDRHLYLTNGGQLVFGVYPGAVRTLTSTSAYNDGTWHLGVATLSGAGMRLYVDGAQVGSDTSVTSGEGVSNGYVRVAYDNLDNWDSTPTSRYFSGTLDDAAYYTTALSAAQVRALDEAGSPA